MDFKPLLIVYSLKYAGSPMKKNILVIAAHPDDEILGVGATSALHAAQGDNVYALIMAEGETSRGPTEQAKLDHLKTSALKAAAILGVCDVFFADFPDNRMDSVDLLDVIKVIEGYIQKISPYIIYTHHGGDLNKDHQVIFEAVITASRPIKGNHYPREIYCFETLSSSEWGVSQPFRPNTYVNVDSVFEKKLDALKCYESEMREFPHPRSYEAVAALAKLRGCEVALQYAEAFSCIKKIKD